MPTGHRNPTPPAPQDPEPSGMRLNRYIAAAGVCSRREADNLIQSGQVQVNGQVVTEMGTKIQKGDRVTYQGKQLRAEQLRYVLLNKQKNTVTTTSDPEGRRTVMDDIEGACEERLVPVGRLDRHTTGLLLLTNDGELTTKLMHPSYGVRKVYEALLDKPLSPQDEEKIWAGLELEDGPMSVDDFAVLSPDRRTVGLEIHIGRNRIVRRTFEHLGYSVERLDRVAYAGLTKKDLRRGAWRFLSPQEVITLKHLGAGHKKGRRK